MTSSRHIAGAVENDEIFEVFFKFNLYNECIVRFRPINSLRNSINSAVKFSINFLEQKLNKFLHKIYRYNINRFY